MPRLLSPKVRPAQLPFETYLHEINETPLLTAVQEKDLAYKIEDGDAAARDHLVRANLRLVVNIARGYAGNGVALQDLIAEGNLGLVRAVEGFDPARNIRFSTFASYWIKQSIKRSQVNTGRTIRIPSYMIELLSKWRQAGTKLREKLGRTPTPEEVAAILNLSKKKLNIIKTAIRSYNSMPQTDQATNDWSLDEMVVDDHCERPDTALAADDDRHQLLELLGKMDRRDAAVLRMRFGLDDKVPKTLKEIGEHLGLTRERVRQIETLALGKLRESLEAA